MMTTSFARFMRVRKVLWEQRLFKVTTSTDVYQSGSDTGPAKRAVHTSPAASSNLRERHLPFWTPGSGYYGQTLGKNFKNITDDASDLILAHLDTVPIRDNGVFTVADYGTNDGSSSMTLMGKIIGQLRKKHGEKLPIQIIYEDQEKNDFNSLFHRLSDGTDYLSKYSNVYPFATNVNFYKQCVPDATCDVIFSSMATHWLENPSVNFKDGFFHGTANADSEELRRFHAEAERDWIKFLLLRARELFIFIGALRPVDYKEPARELKKGGLLIALNISTADDFQGRGSLMDSEGKRKTMKSPVTIHGTSAEDMMLDLDIVWRKLKEENIITQEEYETCLFPAVFRKPKEETAAFEAANSPVVEAGLTLVHHDQTLYGNVFRELWLEKQRIDGVDDRAYFAELIAKAIMVPMRTSFEAVLGAEDKEAILNELYKRFEARVAIRDPETYRADYIANRLVARKV